MMETDYLENIDRTHLAVAGMLVLALAVGLGVQGFGNPGESLAGNMPTTVGAGSPAGFDADLAEQSASTDRKQVTRYNIDFRVPDVQKAIDQAASTAESYGGYAESQNFNRDRGVNGYVTVRVPEDNVSAFISNLEGEWRLESKSRNVDDVTDQYTELELELQNKRQELNRLEELVNQTDEVESLIKIQERMSELRSRIQYLENRLTDLDQRVEYTRIHLQFEGPAPITTEFGLRDSIQQAYRGIFSSINLIIVGIGYLLPFAVIVGLFYTARSRISG